MMRSAVCALVAAVIGSAAAVSAGTRGAKSTTNATLCAYNGYDFSSLTSQTYSIWDAPSASHYYLSVCGVLSNQPACTTDDAWASACQIQPQVTGANVYGEWEVEYNPPRWSMLDNGQVGVQYEVLGANECYISNMPPETLNFVTNVQFVCAETNGPLVITPDPSGCTWNFTVTTPLACPSQPPQPTPACSFDGFDFSSLTGSDIVGSDGKDMYAYYLRVCGSVSSAATQGCTKKSASSSACQVQQRGSMSFDNGNWNTEAPPQFEYIEPETPSSGVQYVMKGAKNCFAQGHVQNYWTTVQLVCSETGTTNMKVVAPTAAAPCNFTYTVSTLEACLKPQGILTF